MGFYTWIRESVKRAVMLGLADAVEEIGSPAENEESSRKLLAMLRQGPALEAKPEAPSHGMTRKRLGKSLEQIQSQAATT
jgi:hypothetical protein